MFIRYHFDFDLPFSISLYDKLHSLSRAESRIGDSKRIVLKLIRKTPLGLMAIVMILVTEQASTITAAAFTGATPWQRV